MRPARSRKRNAANLSVAGADTRTDEERLAKRRKYVPESVPPIADLEAYLPAAGWPSEKAAAVPAEPEAPRRSLRARTERTYVDGEDDDDFDERSVSDDEPPPPRPAAGVASASAPAPAQPVAPPPQQPAPPQPAQPVAPQPVAPQPVAPQPAAPAPPA